jgi:ribosomal protein S18 acetylase RimI-like enzyme
MEVELRRLGPGDAQVLDRVAAEVFDEPIRPERLAAYLAEPSYLMIVALVNGEVVGQVACALHRHPDKPTELYVDEVGVTPALQGRGIARRMIEDAFAWGRELGCEEAWVGTEPDNAAAIALYRGFGQVPVPIVMFEYDL